MTSARVNPLKTLSKVTVVIKFSMNNFSTHATSEFDKLNFRPHPTHNENLPPRDQDSAPRSVLFIKQLTKLYSGNLRGRSAWRGAIIRGASTRTNYHNRIKNCRWSARRPRSKVCRASPSTKHDKSCCCTRKLHIIWIIVIMAHVDHPPHSLITFKCVRP